jgi:hypothetical protein
MFIKNAHGRLFLVSLESCLNHLKNRIPLHIEGAYTRNINKEIIVPEKGSIANPIPKILKAMLNTEIAL